MYEPLSSSDLWPGPLAVVRGAGEMATAVGHCLHVAGWPVLMLEIAQPLAVRRTVAFSEAIYDGVAQVEGVTGRRAGAPAAIASILSAGEIAILVDPIGAILNILSPLVLIDACMAKRNQGTRITDAPIVIALGPGFSAGVDAHAVIETQRGHRLGRIIWDGPAETDTGVPASIQGRGAERVLRAPAEGVVTWQIAIGQPVLAGAVLGEVAGQPIAAPFAGVLRGAIRSGLCVPQGTKIGDVDPRGDQQSSYIISDKVHAIAGGVLMALLILWRQLGGVLPWQYPLHTPLRRNMP